MTIIDANIFIRSLDRYDDDHAVCSALLDNVL